MPSDRKKITLILSFHDKAVQYEWLIDSIDNSRFELSFIFLNPGNSYIERFVANRGLIYHRIIYSGKKELIKTTWRLYKIFKKIKPDVIHCHLFDANLAGLTAAFFARIKKRIYTRHHSTLHHDYFPQAVKWDIYSNRLATHVIAISKLVYDLLIHRENLKAEKIVLIPHGFMLEEFTTTNAQRIAFVKETYNYADIPIVVGVVSRYIAWKGIEYIIRAFKKFNVDNPHSVLILANASGSYAEVIKNELKTLPQNAYREIVFENDSAALYNTFNYFVHTPIDPFCEAFGQTYVEALAANVPSVFTLSGIASEFIKDKENALVVAYKNADAIYHALTQLHSDTKLRNNIILEGNKAVFDNFTFGKFLTRIEMLYGS